MGRICIYMYLKRRKMISHCCAEIEKTWRSSFVFISLKWAQSVGIIFSRLCEQKRAAKISILNGIFRLEAATRETWTPNACANQIHKCGPMMTALIDCQMNSSLTNEINIWRKLPEREKWNYANMVKSFKIRRSGSPYSTAYRHERTHTDTPYCWRCVQDDSDDEAINCAVESIRHLSFLHHLAKP